MVKMAVLKSKTKNKIMKKLAELLPIQIELLVSPESREKNISVLTADSRKVQKDSVYFAMRGTKNDGFDFVPQAIEAGAIAIVCDMNHPYEEAQKKYPNVEFIPVPFPRLVFAEMLAGFYAPLPEYFMAVTGTNGKTSTADFVRQILTIMGHKSASVGTLGIIAGDMVIDHGQTTPDPEVLYKSLGELKQQGFEYVIFEASSHGLEQSRLHGLSFISAGFTNFTRDHLDYHPTEEAYFKAKKLLFDDLITDASLSVIYHDDPRSKDMIDAVRQGKLLTIGTQTDSDMKIKAITPKPEGQSLDLSYQGKDYHFDLKLCGFFQSQNALVACGLVAGALGKNIVEILPYLEDLKTVDGRMDYIASYNGGAIYVDYAHTPDALEKAITAIRPHTTGQLITLFGCGGNRDKGKRPVMGGIAQKLSDITIITDDNPRLEVASEIHKDIMAGCTPNDNLYVMENRRLALEKAIGMLKDGDVLLVAGKGHEEGQTIGTVKHPFKDAIVIKEIVATLK